ncbi:ThiF family protein [Streptomyces rubrolavendulae]|uniref:ThiF family protein n=1 Tax=Streptomyces rubrolavendulae TaxID=285473 RepID=A0A1D8G6A8_9ACTN|nr:TOMM precursor leader peptide-binding protein [Streptomyces rubrolavendulae]AOT60933.1 ThiF family protein [Streptomyces rubrolavendulae]
MGFDGGTGVRPMVRPALRRAWRDLHHVQFGVAPAHAVVVGPLDMATGSLLALLDGTRDLPRLREEARGLGLPDDWLEGLLGRLARAGLLEETGGGGGTDGRAGATGAGGAGTGGPDAGGPGGSGWRTRGGRAPAHSDGGDGDERGSRSARAGSATGVSGPGAGVPDRLRPDLGSLSVVHRGPGEPLRRLAARSAMRVQVRGAGRVGATVAALLSAAGVGRVDVLDGGRVEPWDAAPGGLPPESVGERRDAAAGRLVARASPGRAWTRAGRGAWAAGPVGGPEPGLSLVVVAPRDGLAAYAPDPVTAGTWVETGTPHLFAGVLEATGVVGPLVVPGETACARCAELERVDADPAWPRLLAQWRSGGRSGRVPAGDVGLAAAVAGLTAAHALAFLDGGAPASAGARWEVSSPLLEWRSWRLRPHGACPCGAAGRRRERGSGEPEWWERERASDAGDRQDTMAG